ncbi:hypothetical protein PoB_000293900 [Plakobranchus ocellatus]|uniref:Reverse transcriptase domain-containing protein n=1 Tax=Plakobranchus ocellatus TaxID=259542 RepID=A0AAV3Y315_9GAST|nr:hypothetical protein PoB_000293900 [Plakobranchus ocellatus]
MDVSALYTNIPHGEGIGACKSALKKWRDPNSTPSSSFLCDLIKIILTCNRFQFADDMWLQIHGAAMGKCMAPSYANLFMGELEDKLLASAATKPKIWLRYIDDIFLIWTHGCSNLDTFIAHANNFHPSIKFSSTISSFHVSFLDVLISLSDGILHTDLYSKPTDTFNYLHWSSCHPYHTKKNIPYSLAFRLIRICSSEEDLKNRLHQLSLHLQTRGYPLRHIKSAIAKAKQSPRHSAIQKRNNATAAVTVPAAADGASAKTRSPTGFRQRKRFSAAVAADQGAIEIVDAKLLPGERILLANETGVSVKLFDTRLSIVDWVSSCFWHSFLYSYTVPQTESPYSVTVVSNGSFLVTERFNKTLHLVCSQGFWTKEFWSVLSNSDDDELRSVSTDNDVCICVFRYGSVHVLESC